MDRVLVSDHRAIIFILVILEMIRVELKRRDHTLNINYIKEYWLSFSCFILSLVVLIPPIESVYNIVGKKPLLLYLMLLSIINIIVVIRCFILFIMEFFKCTKEFIDKMIGDIEEDNDNF
ncbi:MAG: hypothetical protein ACRC41_16775 [Sarcina sp.]